MLSPKYKRYLLQLIPFAVIPFIFSLIYALIEKGILGEHPVYPSTGNTYEFGPLIPSIVTLIAGFFIGVFEIFYLSKWFQKSSFIKKILLKTVIYLLLITFVIYIIITIDNSFQFRVSPFDQLVLNDIYAFFSSFAFWSIMIYFSLGVISCLFYAEVSDNIGQSVLLNFFTGKYHRPIEEERIFMFLDMKSSTTIAEQLGHIRYFKMLKEYYLDLSNPIIQFDGQIYQYVGDEVVVTWNLKKGLRNSNCLKCFFAMKSSLSSQAERYQAEYGVVPTFKAGIHFGKVTTGEIGVIKKEIIFTGDVLNTTARIQGLCNSYNVDLLVSEKLIKALKLNNKSPYQPKALGETELRGRNEKINLFAIEKL